MNFSQVQYLIEISKTRSINAAARNLYMSPSSLCASIHKLESELGTALLDTSHKGVELTEKAEAFVRLSVNYFREINELFSDKKYSGTLEILFHDDLINFVFSDALCQFFLDYPNIQILTREESLPNIYHQIIEETYNIAFVFYSDIYKEKDFNSSVIYTPIVNLAYCVEVSPVHTLAKRKKVTLDELSQYTIICYLRPDECAEENHLVNFFRLINVPMQKIHYERNRELLKEKVINNLGVRIRMYPVNHKIEKAGSIIQIPIGDNLDVSCGYIYRKNYVLSDLEEIFLQEMKRRFKRV